MSADSPVGLSSESRAYPLLGERSAAEPARSPLSSGSPSRSRSRPTRLDWWFARRVQAVLAPAGVRLELWNGARLDAGGSTVGTLVVGDRRALAGLVFDPDWYFPEMYAAGRVEVRGDLREVLESLSRARRAAPLSVRERLGLRWTPPNGLLTARRNIQHHYDLGNDFYHLWLDSQLVYTCAYYEASGATLEEAQRAKLDVVCRKLKLRGGETVAEAGCGWGALALHMAREYGVAVKAFNISREQISFARERAAREGLASRVEFIEDDYRSIRGQYDVFVSVGMLEHVGRRQYGALSAVLRRCLKRDGGRGLLHFIGRDRPRPLNPWTRRRIFPGAYPPTLDEVILRLLQPADLSVIDVENLRLHYAQTLRDWTTRYSRAEGAVAQRFGESFCRAWRLYLTGSEAAFRSGSLQLFQVVFAPAGGEVVHWTREELYRRNGR